MYRFRADIGVLTNITPDHLDRYDHSFDKYAASKMRIVQNQTSRDAFVYSADDRTVSRLTDAMSDTMRMRRLPFAAHTAIASGAGDAFCDGESFTAAVGDKSLTIDIGKMRIKGLHNTYNAMAAALATLAAGVAPESICRSIYEFSPVEHRLEPCGVAGGVEYVNDSKATNVDSVWYALQSMTRPTVWIAGGTDKGNDYEPLKRFAREKVRALVCMGIDNDKLVRGVHGCGAAGGIRLVARRGYARRSLARPPGRYGAAVARLRELRPVPQLREPRRGVQRVGKTQPPRR